MWKRSRWRGSLPPLLQERWRLCQVSLFQVSRSRKQLTAVSLLVAIIHAASSPRPALEPEPLPAMVALTDLEADLLAHIARRGGASVLCAMAQTSKQLRAPIIAAGDEMWREFALARFPCLKSLLELVPTSLSFKSIYRKQLAGVAPPPPPSFPDLSAYVFSVELAVPALGWSAAWSAPVTSWTYPTPPTRAGTGSAPLSPGPTQRGRLG